MLKSFFSFSISVLGSYILSPFSTLSITCRWLLVLLGFAGLSLAHGFLVYSSCSRASPTDCSSLSSCSSNSSACCRQKVIIFPRFLTNSLVITKHIILYCRSYYHLDDVCGILSLINLFWIFGKARLFTIVLSSSFWLVYLGQTMTNLTETFSLCNRVKSDLILRGKALDQNEKENEMTQMYNTDWDIRDFTWMFGCSPTYVCIKSWIINVIYILAYNVLLCHFTILSFCDFLSIFPF